MDIYQQYIHISKYARWNEKEGRRETWDETVDRYKTFFIQRVPEALHKEYETAIEMIRQLKIMPSMRSLMTAGKALERDNVAGYNCSYLPIDSTQSFDEVLYILCCGTGVGFSVERQFVNKLPDLPERLEDSHTTIKVADSKIGWAKGYRELISLLYSGRIPQFDFSLIRPAGSILKTFGGRASGPEPLKELMEFTIQIFKKAVDNQQVKLSSRDCHDIVCKIASIVVCGGVRRSALISLSNLTDERMRLAKSGEWYLIDPHLALANNSVCYTEKPDVGIFMKEWLSLYNSKSGERGIFSRVASDEVVKRGGRRESGKEWGTNPCSEIILQPYQFCN